MSGIRLFLYGILIVQLAACGQVVTGKLTTPQSPDKSSCTLGRKIVVLPFADHSATDDDLQATYARNMAIMEALTDQLVAKGFQMPIPEDTLMYLVDKNIVKGMPYSSRTSKTKSLEEQLSANWSDEMKGLIKEEIKGEQLASFAGNDHGTRGLDNKTLAGIGKDLQADYILRGRIIKFDLQNDHTWQVHRRGVLPLFFGATNRSIFGVAKSETYDNVNAMVVGGAIGAAIGHEATTPYSTADKLDPSNANAAVWGAAAAGVAYLAQNAGETPEAVVHLRMWVQKAETGEIIWTNRAEVEATTQSAFADNRPDSLFHTAVKKAVKHLVDNFWDNTELYL